MQPASRHAPAPTARDPLAGHLSRGHIDRAQYLAGEEFRKHVAADNTEARKWLAKAYRELGQDGSALLHDMLIRGMTAREIAASRGLAGTGWEKYFARRLRECLTSLAMVYGFNG